jgi:hypothetical protein
VAEEDYQARFGREWIEFLTELRVALPGVQLLFAFLLTAPFSMRFSELDVVHRSVYFACFMSTTAACAFLIAPSVYHRLHWRRDVRDKEQMIRTCNRLAIAGVVFLAFAMTTAVFMVTVLVVDSRTAAIMTAMAATLFTWLWFGLPLVRRRSERMTQK